MLRYVSALSGVLSIHAAFTIAVSRSRHHPMSKRDAFEKFGGLGACHIVNLSRQVKPGQVS